MRTRGSLVPRLWTALALVVALAPAGRADEALEAAKARYEQGEKHFEAARFVEAAQEFEAAYKLTPRNDLLYDAGHAYDRAGDVARAVELYEAYLRSADEPPEAARVRQRLDELRSQVAYVFVRSGRDGARVIIDGRERGVTPLPSALPLGAGLHRIEVREGDLIYRTEREFDLGLTHTIEAELAPESQQGGPAPGSKRLAALIGVGGIIDVTSTPFPPSQASLWFGLDYRVLERGRVALDVSARVPVELGQSWTNTAILPGLRLVLVLSRKVPLELVPGLSLGLSILHISTGAPSANKRALACSGAQECTLPAFRIHPSLTLVYRFLPAWELRGELFGITADITSPLPQPRVSLNLAVAWRFW